jgi:hypothetical protein
LPESTFSRWLSGVWRLHRRWRQYAGDRQHRDPRRGSGAFPVQRYDWRTTPARYSDNVFLSVLSARVGVIVRFD